MKRVLVFVLISFLLVGCNKNKKFVEQIIYEGDNVKVKSVEELDVPERENMSWLEVSYEDAFVKNDMIFEGIVKSTTEIYISGSYKDSSISLYKTILEMEITSIIKNIDNRYEEGQTIKVITGISSRRFEVEAPSIVEGTKYLIFSMDAIKESESMELNEYCDVSVSMPIHYIVPIIGDDIYVDRNFYSKLISMEENKISMADFVEECSEYEEISNQIISGDKINKYNSKNDILGEKITTKTLFALFSNKQYLNKSEFDKDVFGVTLIKGEDLRNIIKEYIMEE